MRWTSLAHDSPRGCPVWTFTTTSARDTRCSDAAWELPALGAVVAPTAVLIRPDGYVAWVGGLIQLELVDALTTWFGPPTAA
jgi:hypothetical protein